SFLGAEHSVANETSVGFLSFSHSTVTSAEWTMPDRLDQVTPSEISATVRFVYAGDDNDNMTLSALYRPVESSDAWVDNYTVGAVQDLGGGTKARLVTFNGMQPNTSYTLAVSVSDPDGVDGWALLATEVTTLNESVDM